jgi:hypothetical protein
MSSSPGPSTTPKPPADLLVFRRLPLDDARQLESPPTRRCQGRVDAGPRRQGRQSPLRRHLAEGLPAGARTLYEQLYCARGEMENRIKECQIDLFAEKHHARLQAVYETARESFDWDASAWESRLKAWRESVQRQAKEISLGSDSAHQTLHRTARGGGRRGLRRQRRRQLRQRPRRDGHWPDQDRGHPPAGPWRSLEAVEFATLEWVDWFNTRRLLTPIGRIPPAEAQPRYFDDLDASLVAAWDSSQTASRKPGAV